MGGRPVGLAQEECMSRCIGLDLHKRVLEVCILDELGPVQARHRVRVEREVLRGFRTRVASG